MWNSNQQNESYSNRVKSTQELVEKNRGLEWHDAKNIEQAMWNCFMKRDERAQAVNA